MQRLKHLLGEYLFWLAITFVHRLFSIMQPPLEVAHNWRQTTVTMVARNFLEVDPNPFFPRVDMAGDLSGITGMEFPFLNYLIYLVSLVFGYDHWYGRMINLVITSTGLWCFYDYLKRQFNPNLAFNAGMILLFSLFYYYSRKIMPDTFSIALIFIGIWSWQRFLRQNHFGFWLLGFVTIALGVLSKLPSVVVLAFAWPLVFESNLRQKIWIGSALLVSAVASAWWYFSWVPHLEESFGYQHFFMGQTMLWTAQFLAENWTDTLFMFYNKAAGFSGFVAFVLGFYFLLKQGKMAIGLVLTSIILFAGFMLKSGDKFTDHEYYIIPFIPLMAFIGAFFLSSLKPKFLIIILLIISTEGITRKWGDQFVKNADAYLAMDAEISSFVQQSDLVVINSGEYPTPLYFAHRKGWLANNDQLRDQDFVNDLKTKRCAYAIILKKGFGTEISLPYTMLLSTEIYDLYEL